MVNLNSPPALPANTTHRPVGSVLYAIAVIAVIVALFALVAAYGARAYFDGIASQNVEPDLSANHIITIGAQPYLLPAALLADPMQRRDGFAERIDLTLALPLAANGALSDVAITIVPRGRMRTSAVLLDSVYLHQFVDTQLSGIPGLVGKPLETDAGTRGETVWYDPLNANPFVAKCMTPVTPDSQARTCLRIFSLTDRNTAIVAFDPTILGGWRAFDERVEAALSVLRK